MIYTHLARRLPRELKSNLFRYLALFFILVLGIYLVASFSISYDTMVVLTEQTAADHNVEDGNFSTFVAITNEQLDKLRDIGVESEDQSYIDAALKDDDGNTTRVTRIMRVREGINTVAVESGELPKNAEEVMVEAGFAKMHGLDVGSKIELTRGFELTVCGTGVVPDYNMPLKNLSDGSSDRGHFGLVFVSNPKVEGGQDGFTYIRSHIDSPVNHNYAFTLGPASYDSLRTELGRMEFDYKKVDDPLFQETVYNRTKDFQELLSAITKLSDGITKLSDGMKVLSTNAEKIKAVADELLDDNLDDESFQRIKDLVEESGDQIDEMRTTAVDTAKEELQELGYDGSAMTADNYKTVFAAIIASAPEGDKAKIEEVQSNLELELQTVDDVAGAFAKLKKVMDEVNTPEELKDKVDEYLDGITKAYEASLEIQAGAIAIKDRLEASLNKNINNSVDNVMQFLRRENNPRILASASRASSFRVVIWIMGIVLLILVSYVLSVFVVQQLNREVKTIGALYALGLRKGELLAHYISMPTIVTTLGSVLGLVLAVTPLKVDAYTMMANTMSVISPTMVVMPYLIICCVILPPVISIVVNLLSINSQLSKPALALLNNSADKAIKAAKKPKKAKAPGKQKLGFVGTFQLRQIARESRTGGTIIFGVFNCILLIILGLSMQFYCLNLVNNTGSDLRYNYMYVLKYPPEGETAMEHIREAGGECVFSKVLDGTLLGKTANITLMGVEQKTDDSEGSRYFPAECEKGYNSVTISSALADKYFLRNGSVLLLTDSDAQHAYVFYVDAICDYDVGLCAFMDIESMRLLFNQPSDYYNMVVSRDPIGEEVLQSNRVYSTMTKDEIMSTAMQLQSQVMPMVIMAVSVGFLIMILVMIILTSVMIDRAAVGISLVKIFGYNEKEVKKMYINGNFIVVGVGAAIAVPVSILIARLLIDFATLNFNIGVNIFMPWWAYILFFGVVMLSYWGVSAILQRKLDKVPLTEALKSRG